MYLIENMERFCSFIQLLLLALASFSLASNSNLIKMPKSRRAAGVFMLIDSGKYTFNFTAARAACLFLNVTMATRAQMERAVQHGLETCKFGWTAEQIAVIPRLTADKNCGKGKTGVVTWLTSADKKFGVFCFNASDLEETPNRSTASPQSFTFSNTLTAPTGTSTPAATLHTSTTKSPQSTTLTATSTPAAPLHTSTTKSPLSRTQRTTKAPERTSLTSAFTVLFKETHSTLKNVPTSLYYRITSKPAVISFAFSTSAHDSNFSVSSESEMPPLLSPAKPSLGDVPTALIILGIILLLLTAAGIVWYYKLNIFTFWPQRQQKDDIETEMWKHTDSEMDLHSQLDGEEEEESDRKYSSDITLCVNPDIKINSSE